MSGNLTQALRYYVVSAFAVAIDVSIFQVLAAGGAAAPVAAAISYPLAGAMHFTTNRSWTFGRPGRNAIAQIPAYLAVVATGWAATVAVVAYCTLSFHMPALPAKAAAMLVTLPIGFLGHKYITYGRGLRATVSAVVRRLHVSSRVLVAFLIAADAAIFAGGASLERYSFAAAADPRSSARLILALLLANFALLAVLLAAVAAGGVIATRLASHAIARISAAPPLKR